MNFFINYTISCHFPGTLYRDRNIARKVARKIFHNNVHVANSLCHDPFTKLQVNENSAEYAKQVDIYGAYGRRSVLF